MFVKAVIPERAVALLKCFTFWGCGRDAEAVCLTKEGREGEFVGWFLVGEYLTGDV